MAQSAHRYVRGNTKQFYEWLASSSADVPDGPPVWICGDCHVGNLGPVADTEGEVRIHIRDLDQTVIGNPAHDLLRLGLSLASAARGSDLPGVVTAHILEAIMDGYEAAFEHDFDETEKRAAPPDAVRAALKQAAKRTWKELAKDRLEDTRPRIPLGKKFWPVTDGERQEIESLFDRDDICRVVTMIEGRDDDATVEMIDAAYWMKGCSSLGSLRFAVLAGVTDKDSKSPEYCLLDIKEAVPSVAPAKEGAAIPENDAERVVAGALRISPFLGERMQASSLLHRQVVIRELLPQDLKIQLDQLTSDEACKAAEYLAEVVGYAHARQMDSERRNEWQTVLSKRSHDIDAPGWLWTNVVGLLIDHERTYLEHCRRYVVE
jgi:uncharacterized protein (DUF2252 family)